MKYLTIATIAILLYSMLTTCKLKQENKSKYQYVTYDKDPLNVKMYTLKNGLKIIMSVNKDEPRVFTNIAVRAGSKQDPRDNTGLAHYLEHMVFKGTSKIATTNWEEESKLIQQISDLYEAHKKTNDTLEKRLIYAKIDSISQLASKYAVPNEYDKMISSIGAKGTNAYTYVEQTVYVNDIPSNELEKWMIIESERFQQLVLRLFHTELEAVYEEFNRSQDNDFRKILSTLFAELYKKHPYGVSTIGKGEHLKNPSMEKIHEYFSTYYVPNNMAIVLSGDFEPDSVVTLIEKYFGSMPSKNIPEFTYELEDTINEPIVKDVYGSDAETVLLAFRADGARSDAPLYLKLIDGILNNGKAGLIDLNLKQKQKVLEPRTSTLVMADYTTFLITGNPRENQSLEEVKNLLLEQIELLKKGEFEDWLVTAVINYYRLWHIEQYEKNNGRVRALTDAYIFGQEWKDVITEEDKMKKITKEEIVKFANNIFKNNYIVVNKHTGIDTSIHKVPKPKITPLTIERNDHSAFYTMVDSIQTERITPVFVDYKKAIENYSLDNKVLLSYIKNQTNELFSLNYILDMGTDNDKKISIACNYLPYLATSKYSDADLQKEFFKLGLEMNVRCSREKVYISLGGLEDSMEEGIKLLEHILYDVQVNEQALKDLIDGLLKERANTKLNKNAILFNAMRDYGFYGENAPIKNIISEKELETITSDELINIIKSLTSYKHRIFYYGQKEASSVVQLLNQYHKTNQELNDYPATVTFTQLDITKNKVYFVDYDMVQSELIMLSKVHEFNKNDMPYADLYNEYFGSGLSSIVFQEIREAKALAYSTNSTYSVPDKQDKSHYVMSYIGTQSDKLQDALNAMLELMNNMPEAEAQYEQAKIASLKKIETSRITKDNIFWTYESLKEKGIDYDVRKDVYDSIKEISLSDLSTFFNTNIKGRSYTYLVIGKKKNMNMKALSNLGELKELSLKDIFGY